MKVEIVSAGAGTGKTWRLSHDLANALLDGSARPEGVVAITYTIKAAAELEGRIRKVLLEKGRPDLAARVRDGYLGTIHSVCQRLCREFALEAGLSPYLEPIPDSERRHLFDRALAQVVAGRESRLNELARRLSMGDWKAILRQMVDKARENGMGSQEIRRSAAGSRTTLDALLPVATATAADYAKRLESELARLVPALRAEAAADRDNASARERAAAASALAAEHRRSGLPPWKAQVQLAGLVDKKKLAGVAGGFIELARSHHASEPFQSDLREMQAELFALAARAVDTFAAEKAASRVVDFGDMLALAHELVSRPAVGEALRHRLDLVAVDEFQDTSPIQLAVAAALGAIAGRSIWVGDRKQAIFAFQGSDPELMSAAVDWALRERAPAILNKSHRSRPPLVEMVSELFSRALAPFGFPEEQVRLVAAGPDPVALAKQPAFETWRWKPEQAERDGRQIRASEAHAIAAGVEALLTSPPTIRERVEGAECHLRPASCRDVTVLAFRNDRCREIAAALRARGIPATVSLAGLAKEPEFLFARAALALLADPADGIAALEVSWLGGRASADPDTWLSQRLLEMAEWRAGHKAAEKAGERGSPPPLPFHDDLRVAALRAAQTAHLSPAGALDLAIRTAGIPELLRRWPEPERRLANLEALRAEARAYEELSRARHSAATVLGLAARLGDLDDEAIQATPPAEDAVHVATWHGAKGLEWPVVVLSELDFGPEPDVFKASVEPAPKFDFATPLAGRWVRYWPWPYAKMSKGLAFRDAADASPQAERAAERLRAERLRLLYVGFTRARDLLVAVARVDPRKGPAAEALAPLRDERGELRVALPFEAKVGKAEVRVGGRTWPCLVRELSGLPADVEPAAVRPVRWFAAGPRVERPPERLNPSSEPPAAAGPVRLVSVAPVGGRRALTARAEDMGAVGDAIHGFIAADFGGDSEVRRATAARLLAAYGLEGAIDPATLLEISGSLRAWLEARYPGAVWHREWPIRMRIEGRQPRLLVGEVDLFLELPSGFVLVDHKSFPGSGSVRDRRVVEEWAPQLAWYAQALAKALGKPLQAAYVHLPIRGEIAEVQLGSPRDPDPARGSCDT